ncbi:hypothetical protein GCM10017667_11370 [Streptomyces filamentosus]|uniref:Uncharacterized protein n=1 Tax=Streptomyces filamentosus TaxID=67294 RepID=A0A919EIL1_STRFL|nr:hypothetical protein GCM10017667_11370 [Streptomyces filamentosus]
MSGDADGVGFEPEDVLSEVVPEQGGESGVEHRGAHGGLREGGRRRAGPSPPCGGDGRAAQYQMYQELAFRLFWADTLLRMAKRSFITAPPFRAAGKVRS